MSLSVVRKPQPAPASWRGRRRAALWLLLVSAGSFVLALAVYGVFVRTTRGQLVDSAALEGAQIGRRHILEAVQDLLDLVSVGSLALAGLTVAAVAALRRRFLLAGVALGIILGSNVTTQLLKHLVLERPSLGLLTEGAQRNSLPSGHTTVAMSVAVAAVLVAPARLRAVVVLLGAAYGAGTGVATLSAGHHRPSDAVAACLVVAGWAAGLAAFALLLSRNEPDGPQVDLAAVGHPYLATLLTGAAVTLLGGAALATYVTARSVSGTLDQPHLLVAYGGGAALIAGTAFAVLASAVAVVHRVAPPHRSPGAAPRLPGR